MQAGFEQARDVRGSATFCVLALDASSAVLRSANLGDSGFSLYRNGALIFRSKEQQHGFNCPFQLGHGDTPAMARKEAIDVEPGDVVIVASDGLFDNVFDKDIALEVAKHTTVDELATNLANLASINGKNPKFKSPFSINAAKIGYSYRGGKLDDVTVVVGAIRHSATHRTLVTGTDGKTVTGTSSLISSATSVAAAGLFGLMQVSDFWCVWL